MLLQTNRETVYRYKVSERAFPSLFLDRPMEGVVADRVLQSFRGQVYSFSMQVVISVFS